jgi:dipeptide/tripeptide permease
MIYDCQSSLWVLQAKNMNLHGIQPEQMGTLNTILILIFVPFLDQIIYPYCRKHDINCSNHKFCFGMYCIIIIYIYIYTSLIPLLPP